MSGSSSDKWVCVQCTYHNYPASIKCVICGWIRTTKQPSETSKAAPTETETLLDGTCHKLGNISVSASSAPQKWSCPACTYVNWPNSAKCVQCHTTRGTPRHSPPTSGGASPREASRMTNLTSTETLPNVAVWDSALQKWFCTRCTYANWPKNTFCTMCRMPRPSESSATSTESIYEAANNAGTASTNKHSSGPESDSANPSQRNSPRAHCLQENSPLLNQSMRPWSDETLHRIKLACANSPLDYLWLNACRGAVEGDVESVEAYLAEPKAHVFRKLSKHDCRILNRPQIFEPGMNLLKLGTRAGHQQVVDVLASEWLIMGGATRKRMPCHISPDAAREIRHHFLETLRQGKMDVNCYFVRECFTFALPVDIEELPRKTRNLLLAQMLDANVQHELVHKERVINWWCEEQQHVHGGPFPSTNSASERNALFVLWNRTAGDCLLDSVMQSVLGVLDRDNALRSVLTDSLFDAQEVLYARWRVYEITRAAALGYQLDELQLRRDWTALVHSARRPGESLEHGHIFTLAHIFRRPIIVYSVKYITNSRAEPIGYSNYQGVYLPLLWESEFCYRQPIVLGYTRGHFSALVPMETTGNEACVNTPHDVACVLSPEANDFSTSFLHLPHRPLSATAFLPVRSSTSDSSAFHPPQTRGFRDEVAVSSGCASRDLRSEGVSNSTERYVVYLPLVDHQGVPLPVHFLLPEQSHEQESLLHEWLDVTYNRVGLPLACLRWSPRQHPLVNQMLDHWMFYYQQMARNVTLPNVSASSSCSSSTSFCTGNNTAAAAAAAGTMNENIRSTSPTLSLSSSASATGETEGPRQGLRTLRLHNSTSPVTTDEESPCV